MSNEIGIFRNNWKPFKEVAKLQADFEKFVNELMDSHSEDNPVTDFAPSCEIDEGKSEYTLKFDLPGVAPEQVKVELDQNTLTVSAERKEEKKSDDKKTRYSELSYGSYIRTMKMPAEVDGSKAEAKFEHGQLTVVLPKAPSSQPKKIAIKAS